MTPVSLGVDRSRQKPRRLDVNIRPAFAHGETWGDDEELGGDEVEFGCEGEEACVKGGFSFRLFESFAVVEVCVGEDATEAPSERGEMAVRCLGYREAKSGRFSTV
jgi:hypothetical protein